MIEATYGFKNPNSYYFNEGSTTNEYINTNRVVTWNGTKAMTYVIEVRRTVSGYLMSSYDGSKGHYILFNGDNVFLGVRAAAGNAVRVQTTTTFTSTTDFYHIAVSFGKGGNFNASGVQIVVNGVDRALSTLEDTLTGNPASAEAIAIASLRSSTPSNILTGYVNHAAVFERAISVNEAKYLYNKGKPLDPRKIPGCKHLWLGRDTWNSGSSRYDVVDSMTATTGVTVNMEEADKSTVNPY